MSATGVNKLKLINPGQGLYRQMNRWDW